MKKQLWIGTAVFSVLTLTTTFSAQAENRSLGLIGLASNQTLQINLVNSANPPPVNPGPGSGGTGEPGGSGGTGGTGEPGGGGGMGGPGGTGEPGGNGGSNVPPPPPPGGAMDTPPAPICSVDVGFTDSTGAKKTQHFDLKGGDWASAQYSFADIAGVSGNRVEVLPAVKISGPCGKLIATLEVFDDSTGATTIFYGPDAPVLQQVFKEVKRQGKGK